MGFTDKEKAAWHEQRRRAQRQPDLRLPETATCYHCGAPFSAANGDAYGEFPICDACAGD